jgi:hypothetical protein
MADAPQARFLIERNLAPSAGLRALSHHAITRTLIRSLDFSQRYTLEIDFSTLAGAHEQLEATNAFRDAQQADAEGVRLVLRSSRLELARATATHDLHVDPHG